MGKRHELFTMPLEMGESFKILLKSLIDFLTQQVRGKPEGLAEGRTPDLQLDAELQLGGSAFACLDRKGGGLCRCIINTLDKAFEEISIGIVQSINTEQAVPFH